MTRKTKVNSPEDKTQHTPMVHRIMVVTVQPVVETALWDRRYGRIAIRSTPIGNCNCHTNRLVRASEKCVGGGEI